VNIYDQIGRDLAKANLQVNKAIGMVIGFKHRDELPVPLYVMRIEASENDQNMPVGNRVSDESMKVLMPTQSPATNVSGFSGTWSVAPDWSGQSNQPACGDFVTFPIDDNSNHWVVEGEIKRINHGWSYIVPLVRRRTINLGEWS